MSKPKVQTIELVFLDVPDKKHEVLSSQGDTIRAIRWELSQREKGGDKDWMTIGAYSSYLAAKRNDLPHSDLDFLDWLDQVATVDGDEDDPALTRDRFLMLVDEGRVTTAESFEELFVDKETDLGEDETTPLTS